MKIKSLLAAVSMVAIAAGSANALSITNVSPNGIVPALELQLPGTPALTGNFTFDVKTNTGSTYPGGNNLLVDISLPSGVIFSTAVNGGSITGAVNSATVQSGGAVGTSTVQFLVAVPQPATDTLTLNFNLGLNSCPVAGSPLTVNVRTENNTPIEQGVVSTSGLIAPCQSALDGVVTSDEAVSDTKITLASGYTLLQEFAGTGPLNATGVLGRVNYSFSPTVSKSLNAVVPMDATDVASIAFDVVFEDAAGFTSLFVNGIPSVKSGNKFTVTATSAADVAKLTDGIADAIQVFASGTTVIPTQAVSVSDAVVTFRTTGTPDLIASEAGANGALDTIQREGRDFGFFDWNAGPAVADPTVSVYRITGLSGPTDFTVQLENSNSNGTYAGTLTPDATGEAVLVSNSMGGVLPAGVVRYDALINLETANTSVDVDRLMLRSGVVTAYNDGANWTFQGNQARTPVADSDNQTGNGQE